MITDDNSFLNSSKKESISLHKEIQDHIDDKLTNVPAKKKRGRKKATPNNSWVISEMRDSDGVVSELGWNRIESLTKFILKKHFPTISIYKDLIQIGVVKAAAVLSTDPEEGRYSSLRTYVYTCIRNEISNFLYHTHKRTKESSDDLLYCKTSFKRNTIDYKYVDLVFEKLNKRLLIHKDFICQLISILSDSYDIEEETENFFLDELRRRNKLFGSSFDNTKIFEHVFDLLYPIEKQLLILVVNEIKKDNT